MGVWVVFRLVRLSNAKRTVLHPWSVLGCHALGFVLWYVIYRSSLSFVEVSRFTWCRLCATWDTLDRWMSQERTRGSTPLSSHDHDTMGQDPFHPIVWIGTRKDDLDRSDFHPDRTRKGILFHSRVVRCHPTEMVRLPRHRRSFPQKGRSWNHREDWSRHPTILREEKDETKGRDRDQDQDQGMPRGSYVGQERRNSIVEVGKNDGPERTNRCRALPMGRTNGIHDTQHARGNRWTTPSNVDIKALVHWIHRPNSIGSNRWTNPRESSPTGGGTIFTSRASDPIPTKKRDDRPVKHE